MLSDKCFYFPNSGLQFGWRIGEKVSAPMAGAAWFAAVEGEGDGDLARTLVVRRADDTFLQLAQAGLAQLAH